MAARKWIIRQALDSVRALAKVVDQLTLEEVIAALDLESASQRRRSVIDRLIKRAMLLNLTSLQEKYLG